MPFETIISNPMDRVNDTVKQLLQDPETIFDSHMHIFNYQCVPKPFLSVRTDTFMTRYKLSLPKPSDFGSFFDEKLDFDTSIEGMYDFLKCFFKPAISGVLSEIDDAYQKLDKKVIYAPLMMDMRYGWWKWEMEKPYEEQIGDMRKLVNNGAPVLPFLALDPRRDGLVNIFEAAFSADDELPVPFFGVKIYPSLGYYPDDERLMPLYEQCEKHNIPVTAHCGTATMRAFKKHWFISSYKANRFNDPQNWLKVLKKYKKLRLNLAHFGSSKAWDGRDWRDRQETIIRLMDHYEHVYSDFSFNIHDEETFEELVHMLHNNNLVKNRTLYGSDFYMVDVHGDIEKIIDGFFDIFEESPGMEELLKQINRVNPQQFFGLV